MKTRSATELAEDICLYFGASEERTFHQVAKDIEALIAAEREAIAAMAEEHGQELLRRADRVADNKNHPPMIDCASADHALREFAAMVRRRGAT